MVVESVRSGYAGGFDGQVPRYSLGWLAWVLPGVLGLTWYW